MSTYDIIRLSLAFSFGIGLVWMSFVQCMPKIMAVLAILVGSLTLLASGVMLLVDNPTGW